MGLGICLLCAASSLVLCLPWGVVPTPPKVGDLLPAKPQLSPLALCFDRSQTTEPFMRDATLGSTWKPTPCPPLRYALTVWLETTCRTWRFSKCLFIFQELY